MAPELAPPDRNVPPTTSFQTKVQGGHPAEWAAGATTCARAGLFADVSASIIQRATKDLLAPIYSAVSRVPAQAGIFSTVLARSESGQFSRSDEKSGIVITRTFTSFGIIPSTITTFVLHRAQVSQTILYRASVFAPFTFQQRDMSGSSASGRHRAQQLPLIRSPFGSPSSERTCLLNDPPFLPSNCAGRVRSMRGPCWVQCDCRGCGALSVFRSRSAGAGGQGARKAVWLNMNEPHVVVADYAFDCGRRCSVSRHLDMIGPI